MTHPLPVLDVDDLEQFLLRVLPNHVKDELDRGGEEAYRAIARVWERMGLRVAEAAESGFILQATGESRAINACQILRTDTTFRVGFRAGQTIAQTRWGVRYRLTSDLDIPIGVGVISFGVEAELSGFDGNVRVDDIGRWALPPGVDRKSEIAWLDGIADADKDSCLALVDLGYEWRVIDPVSPNGAYINGKSVIEFFSGGAIATLDLLAQERGLPRLGGETDLALRRRIRTLPDVLTPAAIERAIAAYLEGTGATFQLIEPWEYGWTVGDDPRGAIGPAPIAVLPGFIVLVTGLPYAAEGWAIGDDPQGAIGTTPIGTGDTAHEGTIDGLRDLIRFIRAAGVCVAVQEEL